MARSRLEQLISQQREARRQLIADSARKLFAQKEYERVTVREIAKEAGLGLGTIYNYYKSVSDLFVEIAMENARQIVDQMDAALEGQNSKALRRVCHVYTDYLNDHIAFYKMISYFIIGGRVTWQISPKFNEGVRPIMDRLEYALRLAGIHETNTRIWAHALFAALNGIMLSSDRYPARITEELKQHSQRLTDEVVSIFESWKENHPPQLASNFDP